MKAARARSADRRPRVAAPARRAAPRRKGPSTIDRAVDQLPLSRDALRKAGNWGLGVTIGGAVIAGLIAMGIPQMIGLLIADGIGDAGFKVRNVEILNRRQVDSAVVYDIAMRQQARPMPLVDLTGTRSELMKLGWIADARVSRRLPDTLVVDIVERDPVAVWQHDGQLHLIDVQGVVLQSVSTDAMPDLPLVVGPDANRQTAGLNKLMENAPALKPMLAGATWVGNRRWDLRFQSGETLSLPEGDKTSATALVNFARMDGVNRLLGRGIVKFDMRDPDRFILRLPQNQVSDKADASAQSPAQGEEG